MKILNWIGGGFFRTLGRFIAFIVLGAIFSILISKSNIKFTDLLGIETVSALTYTSDIELKSTSFFNINNGEQFTCNTWDSCEWELVSSDSNPVQTKQIYLQDTYNTTDKDYIGFLFVVSQPVQIVGAEQTTQQTCGAWEKSGDYYTCVQTTWFQGATQNMQGGMLNDLNFKIDVEYTDTNHGYCSIQGNEIICPTFKKQIKYINITYNFKTHWESYALFRFYRTANNYIKSSYSQVIENQTQQYIQAQENATQQQIESQKVCKYIDKQNVIIKSKVLNGNGIETDASASYGITDYINIIGAEIKIETAYDSWVSNCFYNTNKTLISCVANSSLSNGQIMTIPSGAEYIRFSINMNQNKPTANICQNGNQALNNYLTDNNMSETNSSASSFFNNFTDNDHGGLSSIITAPLNTINAMLSNTCVAPSATWKGAVITLPCGDMFWNRPGADQLKNLLNVFYGGFVCYYAIRRLFLLIEQLKDPTNDRIEVADL